MFLVLPCGLGLSAATRLRECALAASADVQAERRRLRLEPLFQAVKVSFVPTILSRNWFGISFSI